MKKILVLLSCISFSLIMFAQEKNALIVQLCNDSMEKYILSKKPIISFSGDNMLITVDNKIELNIRRSEVESFCFDYVADGINKTESNTILFRQLDENYYLISGLDNKSVVSVFSVDGTNIFSDKGDESGNVYISLMDLPKGIYIISFGNSRRIKINVNK